MGRPAGSRNAVSRETIGLVLKVFEGLGGTQGMIDWAKKHPTEFYCGIFRHILPKQVNMQAEVNGSMVQLNAVTVTDPAMALSVLEKLEDERNALGAVRGGGDGGEVAGVLPAHTLHMPTADGARVGAAETQSDPDASAAREDDDSSQHLSVLVSDDVSTT